LKKKSNINNYKSNNIYVNGYLFPANGNIQGDIVVIDASFCLCIFIC